MMKTIILLLALSLPLNARIGEKYEDFVKRVGEPTKEPYRLIPWQLGGIFTYHKKGDMEIHATTLNGIIIGEVYIGIDADAVEELLKVQANGGWKIQGIFKGAMFVYRKPDTDYEAFYNIEKKTLTIHTPEYKAYNKAVDAYNSEHAKKKIEGL